MSPGLPRPSRWSPCCASVVIQRCWALGLYTISRACVQVPPGDQVELLWLCDPKVALCDRYAEGLAEGCSTDPPLTPRFQVDRWSSRVIPVGTITGLAWAYVSVRPGQRTGSF